MPAPSATPSPSQGLLDIWTDTQFANAGCEPISYAQEPWTHQMDTPNAYLSIRVNKRDEFLSKLDSKKRNRVEHEIERIGKTRKNFSSYENKRELIKKLEESRVAWKSEVVKSRESFIRKVNRNHRQPEHNPEFCNCQRHTELLHRLQSWEKELEEQGVLLEKPKTQRRASIIDIIKKTKPEDRRASQLRKVPERTEERNHNEQHTEQPELEPMYGFRASAVYFKKSGSAWKGCDYPGSQAKFIGKYPNQKILVHDILEKTDNNPLSEPCPRDHIRWFHFPTNNMSWIEAAIARYYGEDPEDIDDRIPYSRMKRKTDKVLAREFWRGQMHGSGGNNRNNEDVGQKKEESSNSVKTSGYKLGGPVHARHMRSRCSIIPREPKLSRSTSDSAIASEAILSQSDGIVAADPLPQKAKNIALFLPYLHWETSSRRAKMVQVVKEATTNETQSAKSRLSGLVQDVTDQQAGTKPQRNYKYFLGQYLMNLARVADEMDYEADERLLRENVNKNPPLHIRRTLDQYYFLTLEDTSIRDKDQVVYRGTRAGHSFHTRNTRVVMVDQLWLWILDDNTIITSFPRRWGRNKPDPSGVHKSLRERLDNMPENIKSIHHLALIIIDQCSQVFFDRTQALDLRPEVMDLFASAIGHVTELTAIAYESFWRNTALFARNMLPPGTERFHRRYLDINPEGILLQEAQDIAEELQIMKRIFGEQLKVVKDFKRHIEHPDGKRIEQDNHETALLQRLIDALDNKSHRDRNTYPQKQSPSQAIFDEANVHEAGILMELIESRRAEIQDLEDAAVRTCQQLEGLLSLKQQQASIEEAKAALKRAEESIRQGRTIMAFTIVTIFFLPLGFFATFFGMNNSDINDATWMTLNEQIHYMFGLSAIVIVLSISLAFSAWSRAILKLLFRVPFAIMAEYTGLHDWWRESQVNHVRLERKSVKILEHVSKRRQVRIKLKEKSQNLTSHDHEDWQHRGTGLSDESCAARTEKEGIITHESVSEDSKPLHRVWNYFPRKRRNVDDSGVV